MEQKGEVKVFWDKVDGKRVLRISAKHIPEELKNELLKLKGSKSVFIKAVNECNLH
jgi:hypothetical protein